MSVFPRTVCISFLEYNAQSEQRKHHGFGSVTYELELLYE